MNINKNSKYFHLPQCHKGTQWQSSIFFIVQDINYYLKNTTKSIKEIADTLGFDNLSFFGKYVKQHFGSSPRGVRDSITNTAL